MRAARRVGVVVGIGDLAIRDTSTPTPIASLRFFRSLWLRQPLAGALRFGDRPSRKGEGDLLHGSDISHTLHRTLAFSTANSFSTSASVFHTCGVTRIALPRTETC